MTAEDQRAEVQRILQSPGFRRAPKLQRFLELVCGYYLDGRAAEINECLIATQAFGKGDDFDPQRDSLVRVQAREIRRRLKEYYQSEGKSSSVILEIPVGHYGPVFIEAPAPPAPAMPPSGPPSSTRWAPSLRWAWSILAGTVLACGALLVAADHERRLLIQTAAAAAHNGVSVSPKVAVLWSRFLDSEVPTMLVVSNPTVGECDEQKNGATGCPDEYTGMGEAVAIHLITSLFQSAHQTLIVKPSRIVTADDVKRYNLILLGGKSVNIWTRKLGDGLSLAEPNAPQSYKTVMDEKTGQVNRDRAIVALRRHPATGRWVLFLWGHHSQGTHAAAEASTDESFLTQIQWPASPFPDSFHVLLSVIVNDGLPERAFPIAIHVP